MKIDRSGTRASAVRKRFGVAGVSLATLLTVGNAAAQPIAFPAGNITLVSGGWVHSYMRIQTNVAFQNPHACSMTDGYVVDQNEPGRDMFISMILTAFSSNKRVNVTVDGCVIERPRIVGFDILNQ